MMRMKVLRLNSTGVDVKRWQQFLRGRDLLLDTTGTFDAATKDATRKFQKTHGLEVDGVVGNQTLTEAAQPVKPAWPPDVRQLRNRNFWHWLHGSGHGLVAYLPRCEANQGFVRRNRHGPSQKHERVHRPGAQYLFC